MPCGRGWLKTALTKPPQNSQGRAGNPEGPVPSTPVPIGPQSTCLLPLGSWSISCARRKPEASVGGAVSGLALSGGVLLQEMTPTGMPHSPPPLPACLAHSPPPLAATPAWGTLGRLHAGLGRQTARAAPQTPGQESHHLLWLFLMDEILSMRLGGTPVSWFTGRTHVLEGVGRPEIDQKNRECPMVPLDFPALLPPAWEGRGEERPPAPERPLS